MRTRHTHAVTRRFGFVTLLALFMFGSGLAAPAMGFTITDALMQPLGATHTYAIDAAKYTGITQPLPGVFTLHSALHVADTFFSAGGQGIILVGTGSDPAAGSDQLRLVWEPSSSGWVVLWKLRLEAGAGTMLLEPKTGRHVAGLDLANGTPQAGHTYHTYMSVDSVQGIVDVLVRDDSTNTELYRGQVAITPPNDVMYAHAGYVADKSTSADLVHVTTVQYSHHNLPVGTAWYAGRITETGTLQAVHRVETNDDVYVKGDVLHHDLAGQFHIALQRGSETIPLATVPGADLQAGIPLDVARLPLGKAALRLEYIIDGQTALVEQLPMTIGSATIVLQTAQANRQERQLYGTFRIETTAVDRQLPLTVTGHIHQMVWDPTKKDYTRRPVSHTVLINKKITLAGQPSLTVPFAVPLPEEPAMYELSLTANSELQLALEVWGNGKLFTTYEPASPQPGEPYVIALLPDTQNYAAEYPTIFIRQLQWIAEQAAARNILLALHLGDITNDNTTIQWERAVQSITLLNDVMPYMLSQGNHDMTPAGGGNPYDRHHSRMSEFFPVGEQPWIIDTFEPGQIENSYATFNLNGDDYLVIALEFGARDDVLAWAGDVAAQYPDHKGIMITHVYTTRSGQRSNSALGYNIASNPGTTVNNGDNMWHKFVARHPNMMLVFSGHHNSENGISRQVARGRHGNPVYEMMINYQFDTRGGNGHMALMTVQPDGLIEIRAYSPYLDVHRTETSMFGFNNHFFIDTVNERYITVDAP